MATIKKNWLRAGISLFVLLLGVFYIVKARETSEVEAGPKEVPASTTYFYNGPSTSPEQHVEDTGSWDTSPDFLCGAPTQIPCNLEVPANMSLEDYLEQLGSPEAIIEASEKGRTP